MVHVATRGKWNQKESVAQSDLVESVPLVHGVREASCTVSVGGAKVRALRHLHLDLQTPVLFLYSFLYVQDILPLQFHPTLKSALSDYIIKQFILKPLKK